MVSFDFEQRAFSGPMELSAAAARSGRRGARLAFEGTGAVLVVGPLVDLAGHDRLEVSAWTWLRRFEHGQLKLRLVFFRDEGSDHPALPATPLPCGAATLAEWKEAEGGWTLHECSLIRGGGPAGPDLRRFPLEASAARLELSWATNQTLRGEVFLDDVTFVKLP